MSKSRNFTAILIPSATVFLASACIMVLELVAGRLIARHLGSSLYTWTSVIGVVLAGITVGNYIGGRIADRFPARKALAVLLGISSLACVVIIVSNNIVGEWIFLWKLSLPVRVFSHVSLVFLLPSTLLGTISPVVAKMALDKGLATGRTVGDIYAWGAAGSIVGTFLTGFYLIATMGTIAIIWMVGGVLLLMSILYRAKLWVLYIWAAIFVVSASLGMIPADWAKDTGASLGFRSKPDPKVIYEDETQYCYISVRRLSDSIDRRAFMQDKLKHSEIVMEDINDLKYFYTHIYAAVTHGLKQAKEKLSALVIGGGGYVYPRYVAKNWPGSHVDVVEIDPGVSKAAMLAFGLEPDTPINTITMDARNYVDELLVRKQSGGEVPEYDFIYEDAINDYSVPYQLVTQEFNEKIAQILADDGVYMVNLIDVYNSGRFLGSIVTTLEQTFPNISVLSERTHRDKRNTFVIVAARREIDFERIINRYGKSVEIWYLDNNEIDSMRRKSEAIVLTDDYVPVENMLTPVVRQSALDFLSIRLQEEARELVLQGKTSKAIAKYKELMELDTTMTVPACNEIAMILAKQGELSKAAELFRQAIEYNEKSEFKIRVTSIHHNLGLVLERLNEPVESKKHIQIAVEEYRKELAQEPGSVEILANLGGALVKTDDFKGAADAFQQLVNLNPYDLSNHIKLARALEIQGKYDEAIATLKKAAGYMKYLGQREAVAKLQEHIESLHLRKSTTTKQKN